TRKGDQASVPRAARNAERICTMRSVTIAARGWAPISRRTGSNPRSTPLLGARPRRSRRRAKKKARTNSRFGSRISRREGPSIEAAIVPPAQASAQTTRYQLAVWKLDSSKRLVTACSAESPDSSSRVNGRKASALAAGRDHGAADCRFHGGYLTGRRLTAPLDPRILRMYRISVRFPETPHAFDVGPSVSQSAQGGRRRGAHGARASAHHPAQRRGLRGPRGRRLGAGAGDPLRSPESVLDGTDRAFARNPPAGNRLRTPARGARCARSCLKAIPGSVTKTCGAAIRSCTKPSAASFASFSGSLIRLPGRESRSPSSMPWRASGRGAFRSRIA